MTIKWFYTLNLRLASCPSCVEFRCRMGSLASMKHTARSQQERWEQPASARLLGTGGSLIHIFVYVLDNLEVDHFKKIRSIL